MRAGQPGRQDRQGPLVQQGRRDQQEPSELRVPLGLPVLLGRLDRQGQLVRLAQPGQRVRQEPLATTRTRCRLLGSHNQPSVVLLMYWLVRTGGPTSGKRSTSEGPQPVEQQEATTTLFKSTAPLHCASSSTMRAVLTQQLEPQSVRQVVCLHQACRVRLVQQDRLGPLVQLAQQDRLGPLVQLAQRVLLGPLVQLAQRVLQDRPEQLDPRGRLELRAQRGPLDQQAQQELQHLPLQLPATLSPQ